MALLHYENLGVHRPDKLLDRTFYGLRDFNQFLKLTLDHLNSEETVLRLGWSPAPPPDDFEWDGVGAWVELREPDDRPNEPERTFDAFLDDDGSEVFELDRRKATADGPAKRVSFAPERRLQVLDRDPRTNRLLLDRALTYRDIVLRPNTTTLRRQLQAVKELQDAPAPHHLPLLWLFEEVGHVSWPRLLASSAIRTSETSRPPSGRGCSTCSSSTRRPRPPSRSSSYPHCLRSDG